MKIYLTKDLGTFNSAIYLPKSHKVISPEFNRALYPDQGGNLTFFPDYSYKYIQEFEKRIKHPEDNKRDHLKGATLGEVLTGRLIAIKQKGDLSSSQQKMLEKILREHNKPVYFSSFSERELEKDSGKVIEEMKERIETLEFLKDYNDFFQRVYEEAEWVGVSEKIKDSKLITAVNGLHA